MSYFRLNHRTYQYTKISQKFPAPVVITSRAKEFLLQDSNPGQFEAPVTVDNKYAYGANNPLRFADPSGASFFGDLWGDIKGAIALGVIGFAILGPIGEVAGEVAGAYLAQTGQLSQAVIDRLLVIEAIVFASVYTGGQWRLPWLRR